MTRYFQHLDDKDPLFQKVTTLSFIDDTDPNFVLYYFEDGTKCNTEFIADINDDTAYGTKAFAEISDPANKWKFKINEVKNEVQYATAANGEQFEIPDMYTHDNNGRLGKHIEVLNKPKKTQNFANLAEDNTPKMSDKKFDFNSASNKVHTEEKPQVIQSEETSVILQDNSEKSSVQLNEEDISNMVYHLDVNYLIDKNKNVEFNYNGKKYSMSAQEFINNAITPIEEKIIEKEVVKEVVKEVNEEHIEISLDDVQKNLINNMIDMSNKETCTIEMDVTFNLPPTSVYKLIKSVYPEGMAAGFVNIIADRMKTKALKAAVANGLLAYYDSEDAVEVLEEVVKTEKQTKKTVKNQ